MTDKDMNTAKKVTVDRFNIHDIATIKGEDDEAIKAIEEYFCQFAPNTRCPGCQKDAPTNMFGALLGIGDCYQIEWGLVHGHANCRCGWPFVVHHFVKDNDGAELLTLSNYALPVHPEFVTTAAEAAKGAE